MAHRMNTSYIGAAHPDQNSQKPFRGPTRGEGEGSAGVKPSEDRLFALGFLELTVRARPAGQGAQSCKEAKSNDERKPWS